MNPGPTFPVFPLDRFRPWLAFVWGLAEATFFFVVPDVLTSRWGLQKPRQGFAACLHCLAGALLGGTVLYLLGRTPPAATALLAAMDWVPGISPALMDRASRGLAQDGLPALFLGVLAGVPYKLYAAQAAGAGLGLGTFLVASFFSRLSRFLLVTALTWFIGARLFPNFSPEAKLRLHAGGWTAFYCFYFWRMGV